MSTPRSAKAARLRHDYKAHIRAIQISERRVFVYCEGRVHDPYVYSELVRKAHELPFVIYRIEEIAGTGGKPALVKLFKYMRQKKLLVTTYKGKPYCCLFFLDKDVDDIKGVRCRSGHVFYTELYDLDAHIYRDSNLRRAVAIGLSVNVDIVPPVYEDPARWIEAKAGQWKHWLTLCLFSSIFDVDCGCGYGRTSDINADILGATDISMFENFKARLQTKSGMAKEEFDRRFGSVQRKVQRLRSKGMLSLIFKGKWLESIIRIELQSVFGGKRVARNIGSRISGAATDSFSFNSGWAGQHIQRAGEITAKVR